jgi:hypothetical protein
MFPLALGRSVFSFSEPTFHVHQGLLAASGNPLQLHSYTQAAGSWGAWIAVISGAIEEDLLLRARHLAHTSVTLSHPPGTILRGERLELMRGATKMTFDEINEKTGFADGDLFRSAEEVRKYFSPRNLTSMRGECTLTTPQLEAIAADVIANKWHMAE